VEPACEPTISINGFAQGAGQIVAVGSVSDADCATRGAIYHSTDGKSWAEYLTQQPIAFKDVAFGNGRFVALTNRADNSTDFSANARVYVSTDASTWTVVNVSDQDVTSKFAFGNGYFLFAEAQAGGLIYRSSDGLNWQGLEGPSSASAGRSSRSGVEFAAGVFALYSGSSRWVQLSGGGESWTEVDLIASDTMYSYGVESLVAVHDRFVAALKYSCCYGEMGGPWYALRESLDGVTWSARPANNVGYPLPVIETSSVCVAIGNPPFGLSPLYAGTDCSSVAARGPGQFAVRCALDANPFFLVGGTHGILYSTDGFAWEQVLGTTPS
jgi:hypothetical protein